MKDNEKFTPNTLPGFQELIPLDEWNKIQDTFSSITSVGLRTLDAEGKLLSVSTGQFSLCEELKESAYGKDLCTMCLPTFLGGKSVVDKNLSFTCPPGFHNFVAPLRLDHSKVVAYILMGPVVLVMRRPKEHYRHLAEELNVDFEVLWEAIMSTRVISFTRMQSLVELIKEVGEFVLRLAYESMTLGQEVVRNATGRFSNLLQVLLDVAIQVSGADLGSIMLFGKDKQEMSIRVSQGLPENVVRSIRVKAGEGLSGMAVKENRPMLVDNAVADNRIRKYMNRPYLKSSMILPIAADEKVLGVLNLGALEVSPISFDNEKLDAMNKLIDLATDALYIPLKKHIPNKSDYFSSLL
ncbi:MAG TPA: PocR ligand-binding domain-containing protein [Candidatus Omnitrophota bacterium]|nr:PocR ligand-binding domain-containing protein [Candidatus Omnitrophota bacterium]HRZ14823.1 PocR ligand-binding domain-containing protein [Candidatus Omnitrophota bacterium]